MFSHFLFRVDIFGRPVVLTFSGKEKSKSKFGGICSVFYFGFVFWTIYNGSTDFVSKSNPKTYSFESYKENPDVMFLSPEKFPIAVGIQAPEIMSYASYIDESIFKLTMVHALLHRITLDNGTVTEEWTYTDIETEICTPEHFNELSQSFSILDLDKTYCVSRNQSKLKDLYLIGAFESAVYSSIDIRLYECNNETSEVPCAPQEVLDQYLIGGWFNLYYINTVINPKNYNDPNSRYKDVYYTMVTPNTYRNTEIELGHIYVTTDFGWILEAKQTQNYIKVNKIMEFVQIQPHPEKVLMLCTLQMSKLENYFSRSYKKIQDLLAEVGGLANTVLVIFLVITTPYLKLKFQEALMNELFDVKAIKDLTPKKTKESKQLAQKNNKFNSEQEKNIEGKDKKNARKSIRTGSKSNMLWDGQPHERANLRNITLTGTVPSHRVETHNSKTQENLIGNSNISPKNTSEPISASSDGANNREIAQKIFEFKGIKKSSSFNRLIQYKTSAKEHNSQVLEKETKQTYVFPEIQKENSEKKFLKEKTARTGRVIHKKPPVKVQIKVLEDPGFESPEGSSLFSENNIEFPKPKRNSIESIINVFDKNYEERPSKQDEVTNTENIVQESMASPLREYQKQSEIAVDIDENDTIESCIENSDKQYKVNLTLWEFICSFFYKTQSLRQKMDLIEEGVKNIEERFDIKNILKKLRELDKLTALLLDNEQLNLFRNLPKPEIKIFQRKNSFGKNMTFARKYLRKAKFLEGYAPKDQIIASYKAIKSKYPKTEIDERLLQIYGEKF